MRFTNSVKYFKGLYDFHTWRRVPLAALCPMFSAWGTVYFVPNRFPFDIVLIAAFRIISAPQTDRGYFHGGCDTQQP